MPGADARVLLLGAEPDLSPPDGFEAELFLVQGFRPFLLPLQRAGWQVAPQASGDDYDVGLVLCSRHRGESEARLADAVARVKPGGLVVVAGAKSEGADALRRRAAVRLEVEGYAAKHHGTVFWLRRPLGPPALPPSFLDAAAPAAGEFIAAPGMFSHDEPDTGSRLLAERLPGDLKGVAADFGAGWGFLAVELAKRCPRVTQIDLYEADHASLEAAKQNMARLAAEKTAAFFWHDLLSEPIGRRYDVVVMNPPFHRGRAAEPSIGQGMIRAAAHALNRGGRLFLVANSGLPYEAALAENFAAVEELARHGGFKVLAARR
jgi:16S rRNA (guanine1207-N2)-methyltransferase